MADDLQIAPAAPWGAAPPVPAAALDKTVRSGGVNPNMDPAESVLRRAQGVTPDQQRTHWDLYHSAKDEDDLADKLKTSDLPTSVKHDLWEAKHTEGLVSAAPAAEPARSVVQPVNRYQGILAAGGGMVPEKGSDSVAMNSAAASGGWSSGGTLGKETRGSETMEDATKDARNATIQAATAVVPWERLAAPVMRPAAEFAEENLLPLAKRIPYVKKAIDATAGAPSALSAIGTGAAKGASYGGGEELIRTRDPVKAAKGAVVGGLTGGLAGGGAYGIARLAEPAEEAAAGIPSIMSNEPLKLTSPAAEREAPVQTGFNFPGQEAPAEIPSVAKAPRDPLRSQLQQVGDLVKQGAGTPEMPTLQPGVPIGQQPRSVGAAAPSGFPRVGEAPLNAGGKVTFRREPIIKTVGGLEEGPGRAVAPEKVPAALGNEIDRAMKVEPDDVAKWRQGLQTKYPDREHRQLVHSEGEELADTLGNNRELLTKIHDLKNPDVRQLAINSGENLVRDDGSPIMVNNRAADVKGETSDSRILKFNRLIDAGLDPQTIANKTLPGDIPRPSMFKWLLKKGVKPEEMYDLAHKPMEEAIAGKPGPIRSQPWTKPGEKTGD
jgi:hypothetical protein